MKGNRHHLARAQPPLHWLFIMLLAITLILVTGFDPIGQWLGEQAEHIIVLTVIVGLWLYIVYLNAHDR